MRAVSRTLAVFDCFSEELPSLSLQAIANRRGCRNRRLSGSCKVSMKPAIWSASRTRSTAVVQVRELAGDWSRPPDISVALGDGGGREHRARRSRHTARGRARASTWSIRLHPDEYRQARSICRSSMGPPPLLLATCRERIPGMPSITRCVVPVNAAPVAGRASERAWSGYAVTHGERVLGLTAVAAPVRDTVDSEYCIAIAGPTARMKPRIAGTVRIAVRAGEEVSRRLGARTEHWRRNDECRKQRWQDLIRLSGSRRSRKLLR
jgi:hypothetical protein